MINIETTMVRQVHYAIHFWRFGYVVHVPYRATKLREDQLPPNERVANGRNPQTYWGLWWQHAGGWELVDCWIRYDMALAAFFQAVSFEASFSPNHTMPREDISITDMNQQLGPLDDLVIKLLQRDGIVLDAAKEILGLQDLEG